MLGATLRRSRGGLQWREGDYVIDFKVGQSFCEPQLRRNDEVNLLLPVSRKAALSLPTVEPDL